MATTGLVRVALGDHCCVFYNIATLCAIWFTFHGGHRISKNCPHMATTPNTPNQAKLLTTWFCVLGEGTLTTTLENINMFQEIQKNKCRVWVYRCVCVSTVLTLFFTSDWWPPTRGMTCRRSMVQMVRWGSVFFPRWFFSWWSSGFVAGGQCRPRCTLSHGHWAWLPPKSDYNCAARSVAIPQVGIAVHDRWSNESHWHDKPESRSYPAPDLDQHDESTSWRHSQFGHRLW